MSCEPLNGKSQIGTNKNQGSHPQVPSARIVIPNVLQDLLAHDPSLTGAVCMFVELFDGWYRSGGLNLPFFPEYTDHGIRHVSNTIAAICSLIAPDAWTLLTPTDAAILVVATVLHDSAMHITEDGFLDLISSHSQRLTIEDLGDVPWVCSWEDYFAEARRWDGQTLNNLLGDVNDTRGQEEVREDLATFVRRPAQVGNPDKWSRTYRKFIGEFIRRHHGRLAHDIAINGVPGPGTTRIGCRCLASHIADLSGLVARSHNMALRDTFSYLRFNYDGMVICRNSHPIYLMALLRIADYLDVQADRAPAHQFSVRRLRSPISVAEWTAQSSVVEVRPDEEDSECLFVIAKPTNAKSFVKITKLLKGLQHEIDLSWAVLGEIYSKQDDLGLHKLGLTLRRVKSNLDDVRAFAGTVKYIPGTASFGAADADIVKLLIDPLYGDRPEIGIRELMQNAIDAVRELKEYYSCSDLTEKSEPLPILDKHFPEADVIASIRRGSYSGHKSQSGYREWKYWVEVTDRGIGMTADIIRLYFLKAGASFRKSDAWRKMFVDDFGRSKVIRSGRFGVGVFSSFLLGDVIRVKTCSAISEESIYFEASVDDMEIDLIKIPRDQIGTTVSVRISKEMYERLTQQNGDRAWDWYCADDPKVVRCINKHTKPLKQKYRVPASGSPPTGDWGATGHSRYSHVYWTYRKPAPSLCCNGILVQERVNKERHFNLYDGGNKKLRIPKLSIYDSDGALPLNILRTDLQQDVIIDDKEIIEEIVRDFLGFVLACAPREPILPGGENPDYCQDYVGFAKSTKRDQMGPWVSTSNGVTYLYPSLVKASKLQRLLLAMRDPVCWRGIMVPIQKDTGIICVNRNSTDFLGNVLHGSLMTENSPLTVPIIGARFYVRNHYLSSLYGVFRKGKEKVKRVKTPYDRFWTVYTQGTVPEMRSDIISALEEQDSRTTDRKRSRAFVEVFLSQKPHPADKSIISKIWKRMKLPTVIPYDQEKRRTSLAYAAKRLDSYIMRYSKNSKKTRGNLRCQEPFSHLSPTKTKNRNLLAPTLSGWAGNATNPITYQKHRK